jgi:hypothetical protein
LIGRKTRGGARSPGRKYGARRLPEQRQFTLGAQAARRARQILLPVRLPFRLQWHVQQPKDLRNENKKRVGWIR